VKEAMMRSRTPSVAAILGVIAAVALVSGTYLVYVAPPTVVRFDGVALNTTYGSGSPEYFGPPVQNACNETLSPERGIPLSPSCPTQVIQGDSYDIVFYVAGHAGSSPGLWVNMTMVGAFVFEVNPGTLGNIPTTYSTATGLYQGGADELFTGGEYMGWGLVFTLPNSYKVPAGGLWFSANVTIQPTNQTLEG
jgi:hypothetical protein